MARPHSQNHRVLTHGDVISGLEGPQLPPLGSLPVKLMKRLDGQRLLWELRGLSRLHLLFARLHPSFGLMSVRLDSEMACGRY